MLCWCGRALCTEGGGAGVVWPPSSSSSSDSAGGAQSLLTRMEMSGDPLRRDSNTRAVSGAEERPCLVRAAAC